MYLSSIMEFTERLASQAKLMEIDAILLAKLQAHIRQQSTSPLDDDVQQEFILKLYQERFKAIKNTEIDYTCSKEANNQIWLVFAQKMAPLLNKPYFQIVYPDVTNVKDPNTFLKIPSDADLLEYSLSEDDKTLYSIIGLIERIERGNSLFNYKKLSSYSVIVPLSIKEMLRIRMKKKEAIHLTIKNKYSTPWSYLESEVLSRAVAVRRCPSSVVFDLYDIVNDFYSGGLNVRALRHRILLLGATLQEKYSPEAVTAFYGQTIKNGRSETYLINLLLDCFSADEQEMSAIFAGICRWMAEYDPSLIIKDASFAPVYRNLQVGPFFSARKLCSLLSVMAANCKEHRRDILAVKAAIEKKKSVTKQHVHALFVVYSNRWQRLASASASLDAAFNKKHGPWKLVAQYLSGAERISANYFTFLMPTLTREFDIITQQPITRSYHLKECILSEDKQELIYLPHCLQHFKSRGLFYIPQESYARPFTFIERNRLKALRSADKYIKQLAAKECNVPPLSLKMVLMLQETVDKSFFAHALQEGESYTKCQLNSAQVALYRLKQFLKKIPKKEKAILERQPIILYSEYRALGDVLSAVFSEKECVSVGCTWIAKLVKDYLPWVSFREEVNKKINFALFMQYNTPRLFRADEFLIQRLRVVYGSLFFYKFTEGVWQNDAAAQFPALPNNTPPVAVHIFQLLQPIFQTEALHKAPDAYSQIMQKISQLSTAHCSFFTWMSRPSHTDKWLKFVAFCCSTKKPNNKTSFGKKFNSIEKKMAIKNVHQGEVSLLPTAASNNELTMVANQAFRQPS